MVFRDENTGPKMEPLLDASFGFVRVAAAVPAVFIATPEKNADRIIDMARQAADQGVHCWPFRPSTKLI